jgi:hypothetical protein
MCKILIPLFFSLVFSIPVTFADTPVDREVTNALADISKYEQQYAGKTTAQKSAVNRTLKLLSLTRQRLDSAADHSTPAWQGAENRLNSLIEHLQQLASGGSTAASSTPTKDTSSQRRQQNTQEASSSGTASAQMISHQRVQVKKLTRDIISATDTLDKAGPKPFQNPSYVTKKEESLARFKSTYAKFTDFEGDPDVQDAAAALAKLENMMAFGKDHAAKELAAIGNIQEQLTRINQEIRQIKIPETPQPPYRTGQLGQWLVDLAKARKSAIAIYQPLPQIKERAYLPDTRLTVEQGGAYDLKDVDRLERSLRDTVNKIDTSVNTFTQNLEANVQHEKSSLEFYETFDPADPMQQANHFLTKGRADEVRGELAQKSIFISEAANYAKLLKHANYEERTVLLERIKKTSEQYEINYQKALELVRLPTAVTTDSDLMEIARETLENPKYTDVGDIKRLVINTEKTHRSMETTETEFDKIDRSLSGKVTLSGTATTYHYEWDEFQVATAEAVGDKHYIHYTTLKYYTSGASTTPLNKWIISYRNQSSEIPLENIERD